ncbi:hypothetical protein PC129_g12762 [Phytophthora cactorum]|uniref:Uncharacterized protein n=1 Tax=Phytophthora cactorum TaxID=29920 RepID=A0A8T1K9Q0_9STRA|nr:hypothetical protein Pcac1_g15930 [Phytophthora cactorum]KAG2894741.1 hypothetical protein PC114_g15779 [Phytophthora cactorum]KAG2919373.1 hypothetical protein PC117_g16797 [Phytophthora cactorum]KAG3216377.1 hypothetical protein PC129_g12762 [Phytophthora cactorum]KAG4232018.1 hypothetical protein PC116_g19733 [Phytophthora cactorum]
MERNALGRLLYSTLAAATCLALNFPRFSNDEVVAVDGAFQRFA